jgi:hypothetical protein
MDQNLSQTTDAKITLPYNCSLISQPCLHQRLQSFQMQNGVWVTEIDSLLQKWGSNITCELLRSTVLNF